MRSLRCGTALVAAILAATALTGVGRAEEKNGNLETKALDLVVKKTLRDVINRGADVYNAPNSDYLGCYHLYEGALIVVRPLLDGRPELQKEISEALVLADREAQVPQKAYVLRKVLDKIRDKVDPDGPKVVAKTLWDKLGGDKGVSKVVDDLFDIAGSDPKVNFWRTEDGKPTEKQLAGVPALKKSVVAFISSKAGGNIPYEGKNMKDAHKNMGITSEQFDAFAADLKTALEKNGVKGEDLTAVLNAVGGTKKDIVQAAPPPPPKMTLWEKVGGEAAVTKVVDDLFDIAGVDPKVNFWRTPDGKPTEKQLAGVPALKKSVVAYMSSKMGGKIPYEGKDMKDAHKGMGITSEQFDAFAADLKKALEKNGVKAEDVTTILTVVGSTKKDIVEAAPPPPKMTLWEKVGGEAAVTKVVDDLFEIAGADPKVNFWRTPDGKPTEKQLAGVPALKKSVVAYMSSKMGGKIPYEGKDMKDAHKDMGITSEQFDAFAADLKKALEKNGVKAEDVTTILTVVGGTKKDIVEKKE